MSLVEEKVDIGTIYSSVSNATGHLNLVEALIKKSDKQSDQNKFQIQLFRQQLQMMKVKIQEFQKQILNTLTPAISSCYQELTILQLQQKEGNIIFQNQITELKKQKMIISQMISLSNQHTQDLIAQVGEY